VQLIGSLTPLQFKQLELVLALALHPSGLSNTQLAGLCCGAAGPWSDGRSYEHPN
jgi:hypothetical protein